MKNCLSQGNKRYGINFSHRDPDNVADSCIIKENGKAGIIFRKEDGKFHAPDRNIIKNCSISDKSIGVWIDGWANDVTISNCKFANTSKIKDGVGLKIEANVGTVNIKDSMFENIETETKIER